MKPTKQLRYVHGYKDRHGKQRYYYRRSGRKLAIKGEFNSPEWLKNYSDIHESFTGEKVKRYADNTFGFAVEAYLESPRYLQTAEQTRYAYRLEIDKLTTQLGDIPIGSIKRSMIISIRDKIAETSPRRGVEVVKVMKLIFQRARDLDLIDRDPTRDLKNPVGYKAVPHEPWPEESITKFLGNADPVWRRALMVLLHTGLRRGDAVAVRRDQVKDGRIAFKTAKTGAEVVIPITAALAKELETPLPIEGLTLIVGTRGRPIRGDVLHHSMAKQAKRIGIEMPPLHGLRKNAVQNFLEHGLEYEMIRAITGQSDEMIRHYGQNYNRHRVVDRAEVIMLGSGDKKER